MCSSCGTKLQLTVEEEEVKIYVCPICKDGQLIISGELLKRVIKVAEITKESVDDLIINAIKTMRE
jgi:Zn-finger nucleic acid-binding protein